mmetsp:Transcript_28879/g.68795  ORF Transcript_28879/g.68795 Transcript_28879/m.68795 type:complete len:618 (-) Transcript_28879:955-2808(-)
MTEEGAPPPRPVVICGPSGVGKGTLIELLQKHFAEAHPSEASKFGFSVSHTTRKPRDGEQHGVHYNFTTVDDIKKEISEGKFVEYAEVHGNYYGTSVESVESVLSKGKICLLDIDIQGAQNVKKSSLDAYYIFISPPSMEELERRLRGRGTEKEESILKRLKNAKSEMDYGTEDNFDKVLVNNDLQQTLEDLVELFSKWFPSLLAESNGVENGNLMPPVVDPLSYPKNDEGLRALLSAIDEDCPLEGYVQTELNYKAANVKIPAGKTLDIPLPPVEHNGSKIEWSVTLVDEYNESLDLDFGLVVVVEGNEVECRKKGRIVAPANVEKEGNDDATSETDVGDDADGDQQVVSAKGKFTVANSAPVTVILKLDNSYSWLKPKFVSYEFTIMPPVDSNMIKRSERAKSVLPSIIMGQQELEDAKNIQLSRAKALGRMEVEMEGKRSDLSNQIDDGKKEVGEMKRRIEEAQDEAKRKAEAIKSALDAARKEDESIDDCTKSIIALEEECARLKRQWEELKVERAVREEERLKFEQAAANAKGERENLQEEISAKRGEEQGKLKHLEGLESERKLLENNLIDLTAEKKAREDEGDGYAGEIKFLNLMMEKVKLRFVDIKSKK